MSEILDPSREIVDPHHHLWPPGGALPYSIADLAADTGSGHNVAATVFMECHAAYRPDGPEHLRVIGETEFVAARAEALATEHPAAAPIVAIVGHADLAHPALDAVLDAHVEAASGRFRGIRDALSSALEPEALAIPGMADPDRAADESFRAGVRRLGERGFTYDSWHYHHQNADFAELARACPDTTMVLDHFGTPLGVGRFAGKQDEIFEQWKLDIADIASCPNTVAKLGGLAMPDNGFGWHETGPPTLDKFVAAQGRYYRHAIESFGPERCMFESNFPVDKFSVSYDLFWNAAKTMVADFSEDEKDAMFSGTARRVYKLN